MDIDFEFIETDVFTKQIQQALSDENYGLLQRQLIKTPKAGNVVPGGKGIRKFRWALPGKGKSGGVRVLYYLYLADQQIYMLYVFKKSDRGNLSREELNMLGDYVQIHLKSQR